MKDDLVSRYRYGAQYITDYDAFKSQVLSKTVMPHQVEVQPASRKKICWLECPYCYGASAEVSDDRLTKERAVEVLQEIADGGVKKIILAGYATDPLNCAYIDDLVEVVVTNQQTFGFNTKALKVSDRFIELLTTPSKAEKSYISFSVDAGDDDTYNRVHAVANAQATLYTRVLDNVRHIAKARDRSGVWFDMSAAYLINGHNHHAQQVLDFITQFKDAG